MMKEFLLRNKVLWIVPLIVVAALVVLVLFSNPVTEKPFTYTIN